MSEKETIEAPVGARQKIANARRLVSGKIYIQPRQPWQDHLRLIILVVFLISVVLFKFVSTERYDYPEENILPVSIPKKLPSIHDEPQQGQKDIPVAFEFKGYSIQPLASYVLTARVLGTERYYLEEISNLSPLDLALGWQEMGSEEAYSEISISQSNRWLFYRYIDTPVEPHKISSMSANVHIVPASREVEKQLFDLDEGDIVTLGGFLISVSGAYGYQWNSSLSRHDTGKGACEILFVQYVIKRS